MLGKPEVMQTHDGDVVRNAHSILVHYCQRTHGRAQRRDEDRSGMVARRSKQRLHADSTSVNVVASVHDPSASNPECSFSHRLLKAVLTLCARIKTTWPSQHSDVVMT